jgi:MOSC domain-containing protein YiiM
VRIPCRVFGAWLREEGWVRRFTDARSPGAYLRVLEPGAVAAGDPVEVEHRPAHDVTVALAFQALTTRPDLLPRLRQAPALAHDLARRAGTQLRSEPTVG